MLEGVYAGIEDGWFVGAIADAAYRFEREVNAGRRIVVGVNAFTEGGDEEPPSILRIGAETEERQRERLAAVKRDRSAEAVESALERIAREAADPAVNLMPAIVAAAHAHATVGEVVSSLERVFGTYVEAAVV
jgi:methylmalonyl-CoA mutase N-terminal domain/subunit